MAKNILLILLVLIGSKCIAQNNYLFTYDDAGNRTERILIQARMVPGLDSTSYTIKDKFYDYEFIIYPNPTTSIIIIDIFPLPQKSIFLINDASGHLLYEKESFQKQTIIDMSKYENGIFILT